MSRLNLNLSRRKNILLSKLFLGLIFFSLIFISKAQSVNANNTTAIFNDPNDPQLENLIGQLQDNHINYEYLGNGKVTWEGDFIPPPTGVGALVYDIGQTVQFFLKAVKDYFITNWKERAKSLANIAYKNTLRSYLSNLAYDTATRIVEGDWGKGPLYNSANFGTFLRDIGEISLIDSLDAITSENGFLKFDVCNPASVDFKVALNVAIFDNFQEGKIRTKPRCSWQQIANNWEEWTHTTGRNLSTKDFLKNLQNSFTLDNSQTGIYLTISSKLAKQIEDKKTAAAFERLANQNFKDLTAPISGTIKTPAGVIGGAAIDVSKPLSLAQAETISTGDIVADSIGIFTNTLAAKAIKQFLEKGFSNVAASRDIFVYNWAASTSYIAEQSFASYTAIHLAASGEERLLEPLADCPDSDNPGATDCVITSALAGAIEQKMTVQQAVNKGLLKGNGYFGFKAGGYEKLLDYQNNLPYRSLVILRQHRVIPSAWELAALYWKEYGFPKEQLTLNYVLNCFEDPAAPANNEKPESCVHPDLGFNPYYHLVDPNWVLTIPGSECVAKGSGVQVLSAVKVCLENNVAGTKLKGDNVSKAEILTPACDANLYENPDKEVYKFVRNDQYCADYRTCLTQDADGKCLTTPNSTTDDTSNYGYCLQEEQVWRLPGKTCEPQFDTCELFQRTSDNQTFSYLRNTLQECSSQDGGCWWYSTVKKAPRQVAVLDETGKQVVENDQPVFEWQSDWSDQDRIYLNNKLETCGFNDVGCTKLSRLLPGTNLVFNGNFSNIDQNNNKPLGWKEDINNCATVVDGVLKLLAECSVTATGKIPVDSNFTYVLSANLSGGSIKLNQDQTFKDIDLFNGVEINFPAGTTSTTLTINAGNNTITADNIQLLVKKSPIASHNPANFQLNTGNYQLDYSQNNDYGRQYLKVAPSYLNCGGYNQVLNNYIDDKSCQATGHFWRTDLERCVLSGSEQCANFAAQCKQSEVGCQAFTPVDGGAKLTGSPREADYCPQECVGYDSFLEKPTKFDFYKNSSNVGRMVNFIPQTAKTCKATEAGCEEFTNLDSATAGGENKEYFTDFRQCVPKENVDIISYYTWEGSDTFGYQLKKWEFLKSNLGTGAPCVNLTLGSSSCADTADNTADKYCSAGQFREDLSCREFFNAAGVKFYILQDAPIVASEQCRAYRRAVDNEVYNVDLNLSKRCSASVNGCREYKGNQSNNQKTIFNDTFEDGTVGDWTSDYKISATQTSFLNNSTEALNQGGHSLALGGQPISNNLYRNIQLTPNKTKEYRLSFWAKKVKAPITGGNDQGVFGTGTNSANTNINAGDNNMGSNNQSSFNILSKAHAQSSNDSQLNLSFDTANLNGEWQLFTTDKVEFTADVSGSAVLQLNLAGVSSNEIYYLDNIVLTASADIFYVIKDSWQMPKDANGNPICDQPFVGAQLGCRQYKDSGNNDYYLKSLNSLCSSAAIGCEAYINTQNSTYSQGELTQEAGTCSAKNGIIKQYGDPRVKDDRKCYINNRLVCKLTTLKDGSIDSTVNSCTYMNAWTVPNDEMIYLVNDPSKSCSADKQGCSLVGKPAFDRTLENYLNKTSGLDKVDFVKSYQDLYLINNPDTYVQTACAESGLFCSGFKGEISGPKYYYDPQGFKDSSGNDLSRTCYYKDGKWYQTGSNPAVECAAIPSTPYLSTVLPTSADTKYQGLVGLCAADQSSCTGFREPQAKSITAAAKCDAKISPRLTGVCGDDPKDKKNGSYCVKSIDGVDYNVCKLETGKSTCDYSAFGWYCAGRDQCSVNQIPVCEVTNNEDCQYSLVCPTDYYLQKGMAPGQDACSNGKINPEGGCSLFFNSGLPVGSAGFAADATKKLESPARCDSEVAFGKEEYCNANEYYGVARDRQCASWLSCGSSMVTGSGSAQETCQELIKCDRSGYCQKASDQTSYNLNKTTTDLETVRYLSGFSKPTVSWGSNTQEIIGRASPENLQQVGNVLPLANGGFEIQQGAIDNPASWSKGLIINHDNTIARGLDEYKSGQCSAFLDETMTHTGHYSLELTAAADLKDKVCYYQSNSGPATDDNSQGFFEISAGNKYVISFYARSSTGQQKFEVGLALYDSQKNICDKDKTNDKYCNNNNNKLDIQEGPYGNIMGNGNQPETPPTDIWQKYTYVFDSADFPGNAKYAKALIIMNNTFGNNADNVGRGSIWFDDFSIGPVLKVNDDYLNKECRLFPDNGAPVCYYADSTIHRGWSGYCLDPDPFYQKDPLQPNDYSRCLQWYPVSVLQGDEANVFSSENDLNNSDIVYTGPRPLYYCLQSSSPGTSKMFWNDRTWTGPQGNGKNPPNGECGKGDWKCNISFFQSDTGEKISVADLNINQLSWLWAQNTTNHQGEAWPEPIVDFSDIKNHYCGEEWVATTDSSGNPSNMFTLDCPKDRPGVKILIFYPYGKRNYSYDDLTGDQGRNFVALRITFDQLGNIIEPLWLNPSDGIGDKDETVAFITRIYPKEICSEIAQVVDTDGREKVRLGVYNDPNTTLLGYKKELANHPNYGSGLLKSFGGFQQPADPYVLPDQWTPSQVPLSVYFGSNGGGFAGLPLSVEPTLTGQQGLNNRVCVAGETDHLGKPCLTNTDCEASGNPASGTALLKAAQGKSAAGVCAGLGKLCYYGDITYGQPCGETADNCAVIPGIQVSCNLPATATSTIPANVTPITNAIANLQSIFAKIFKVWKWENNKYNVVNNVNDDYFDLDASGTGTPPVITEVNLSKEKLGVMGGKTTLNFNIKAKANQLPIRKITVDWGDGSNNVYEGIFGNGQRSFNHFYGCIPNGDGTMCDKCYGNVELTNGQCSYTLKIEAQDNWEVLSSQSLKQVNVSWW